MHTNKTNNKKYIGQTSQGIKYRWRENGTGYKGQPFYNAIIKCGWDNFTHEILKDNIQSQEDADKWEKYFILKYNTYNPKYGYNSTKGGNISTSAKGYPIICEGKEFYSVAECSRYLDVDENLLREYLKKKRLPPHLYAKRIHFKNDDFSNYKEYTDENTGEIIYKKITKPVDYDLSLDKLDKSLTIHDFRMVKGPTHVNVIFDIVVPYDDKSFNEVNVLNTLEAGFLDEPIKHNFIVRFDHPYEE